MIETYLFNLGSLLFGIIAWMLPFINLVQHAKSPHRKCTVISAASLSACGISLCLQIFELNHRINIQDWSALLDTSNTVAIVAAVLLVVTISLNVLTVAVHYKKQPEA